MPDLIPTTLICICCALLITLVWFLDDGTIPPDLLHFG